MQFAISISQVKFSGQCIAEFQLYASELTQRCTSHNFFLGGRSAFALVQITIHTAQQFRRQRSKYLFSQFLIKCKDSRKGIDRYGPKSSSAGFVDISGTTHCCSSFVFQNNSHYFLLFFLYTRREEQVLTGCKTLYAEIAVEQLQRQLTGTKHPNILLTSVCKQP